jgi:hypothetical protein
MYLAEVLLLNFVVLAFAEALAKAGHFYQAV